MSWLSLVDDVLKVAFKNGDDIAKIAARSGNSFGDELIKGLYDQRKIGRLVNAAELDKLTARGIQPLARAMELSGNQSLRDYGTILNDIGLRAQNVLKESNIDDAINAAKAARQGKGFGGALGHGIGRVVNRGQAALPAVKQMGTEAIVGTALVGIPTLAVGALMNRGNNQANDQVAAIQEAVAAGQITPEEGEAYLQQLSQQY